MLACACLLGSCASPATAVVSPTPAVLEIEVLYPKSDTVLEMGDALHVLASATGAEAEAVSEARMTVAVFDPAGELAAEFEAAGDAQGTYRSPAWPIPHRSLAGEWRLELSAVSAEGHGTAGGVFEVLPSTSEVLLSRYGFWVDAPTLRGIDPFIAGEFGDAANGRVLWGGSIASIHVLPATWLDIQWRRGPRPLATADDVRRFFLEDLGRFGFSRIRSLGPMTPVRFKEWPAWRVSARGEFEYEQVEWMVFHAPEVDRTFALGTTIVLPPVGIDAPTALRQSFQVFPEEPADGVAPAPLPSLEPAPEIVSPALGAEFFGGALPVTLAWKWLRPLADDEAYLVQVDYNYRETKQDISYTTRENQLTLPSSLYQTPNCRVFNWQVSVVRPGASEAAVSYDSLYAYVIWSYPPEETRPFAQLCPNAQY